MVDGESAHLIKTRERAGRRHSADSSVVNDRADCVRLLLDAGADTEVNVIVRGRSPFAVEHIFGLEHL